MNSEPSATVPVPAMESFIGVFQRVRQLREPPGTELQKPAS